MTDNHLNRRIDDKRDTRQLQWVDQLDALHPDYQKALRTRDELEDHIARCGAQLLDMLGVGGFLVPIPGTNPVQYVAAGTLEMIGNVMQYAPGSPVSTAVGEPVATVIDIDRNTNESIIDAALEPGTALYLAAPTQAKPVASALYWSVTGSSGWNFKWFGSKPEHATRIDLFAAPTRVSAPQADATQAAQVVWVSIDDRLPEDGDEVMICGDRRHEEGKYQAVAKHSHGSFYDDDHNEEGEYINVTHWMSLPAEPGEVDAPQAGQEAQASAAQEVRAVPDLHDAIMNLPCKPGRAIAMNAASAQAYKEGHRDARHAAAELAIGYVPEDSTSTAPAAMDEKGADHE